MTVARRNSRGQFAVVRKPPPPLEMPYPDCSLCGKETNHDGDSFVCACGAYWSEPGVEGRWDDPNLLACSSAIKPYDRDDLSPDHEIIRHTVVSCWREDGHSGQHQGDLFTRWSDGSPFLVQGM